MANRSWDQIKSCFSFNSVVEVRVMEQKPFGLLVAIDGDVQGIIERIGLSNQGYSMEHFPIGSTLDAEILGFRDWSKQVELRAKVKELQNG